MMRENLSKYFRGETEKGSQAGCRSRKRLRNNIDMVDADSDQQDGAQEVERGAQNMGRFQRGTVQRLGRAGIRRFRPRGGHQNSPFLG